MKVKLNALFGIDLRSLAVLRIAFALLIVVDLINRATDLVAHYTDAGVLPRAGLMRLSSTRWFVSLHLMSGVWEIEAILFLVAGLFGLALLVGYKTRVSTIVSWFFLMSLHVRNPLIVQGGDIMLRVLLFWSIFLPLGARYSLDGVVNASSSQAPNRVLSAATFAYLMQIVFVYGFTVLQKTGAAWRSDGSAIYYALSLDYLTTPVGEFLRGFPNFLTLLTHAVFAFEVIGPFLLFSPIFTDAVRVVGIALFLLLHLGFLFTLKIGLFPWVGAISMIAFLPSPIWDGILSRLRATAAPPLTIYYDKDSAVCEKSLHVITTFFVSNAQIIPAQTNAPAKSPLQGNNSWTIIDRWGNQYFGYQAVQVLAKASPLLGPLIYLLERMRIDRPGERIYECLAKRCRATDRHERLGSFDTRPQVKSSRAADVCIVILLTYVFFWNMGTLTTSRIKIPERFKSVGYVLGLDQIWNMFAPYPPKDHGWYVIPGKLKSGAVVNLFGDGQQVRWGKPTHVSTMYRNSRWRKYMEFLWASRRQKYLPYYAEYLCRKWNTDHRGNEMLQELAVFVVIERTALPGEVSSIPERVMLLKGQCSNFEND